MRQARIKISKEYLLNALNFPVDTEIKSMQYSTEYPGVFEMVVEHEDLPEILEGAAIPTTLPILTTTLDWNIRK